MIGLGLCWYVCMYCRVCALRCSGTAELEDIHGVKSAFGINRSLVGRGKYIGSDR